MAKKKDDGLTGTPEYDELVKVQRDAQEMIRAAGKKAVAALFKAFFAANQEVTAIGWTQYTPYFNDGEPCEFSVNGDFAWSTKAGVDWAEVSSVYADGDDEGAGWKDEYSGKKDTKREREIQEAVKTLGRAVNEDVFEAAFGDHVMVIATPDGFHVSEYDHD